MPKATIIIVTYNGLEKATQPCLESVFRYTGDSDYEVVVVDNNSTDGTCAFLIELALREPRLKVILNTENRGFAGGNNDALREAQGDILILLNNDTQVTQGWMTRIVEALTGDTSVGMVGPATNSAGNEQNIYISADSLESILSEGSMWTQMGAGDSFLTEKLCFFCVAVRRDVLETVGMLDESFGLGFYEDDDYCIRVRNAGYSLKCLEDVFVYHQGSASFRSLPVQTKNLLKRNKKLLETKHGIVYSTPHPRERQMDLAETYIERLAAGRGDDGLWFRLVGRLKIVKTLAPNGFLKKFHYYRRLRLLVKRASAFDAQGELA